MASISKRKQAKRSGRAGEVSRRIGKKRFAVLTAATCSFAPEAFAQLAGGGLTDSGLIGSNGSLRDTVGSLLSGQPSVNTGLPWTFNGALDVEVGATDSPGGGGNGGWQPFILIAPDLNLQGVTSRLNVSLNYSPRLAYYPSSASQTLLSNNFNGTATATVVPDLLYFNVRGLTGISSRFGNTSLLSNSFLTESEAVQTSSFSATPYLMKTFGGIGTLTVGYTYARTFQSGNNNYAQFFPASTATNTAGFGTIGDLETSTEFGSFTTGENFGRIQNTLSATASQNGGGAFYQGSSTFAATNTVSYSVVRWLSLLASVGYEEYSYPQSGYRLSEPTWSVGATVIPNADSSITVQYGQTAGTNTILANGTYAPTARTRVYGSYTVGIQTGLGARQGLLGTTTVGPGGLLLDRVTGAPVLANSYLASQYSLSRVKTLSVGGVLLLDRDTFSASISNSQATQLVGSTDVFGIATNSGTTTDSTYASLSWQHELNPSTSLYSTISYFNSNTGVYFGNPGSTQDTVQLYSGLTHTFTDTLSGSLSFSHAERFGGAVRNLPTAFGGPASQNTALVGLRKSF